MYKFSLGFRNISCIISKNISSKVILKCHISMLTCLFRLSQNPFQSNKNCESCIRSIYQLEISKICIRFFLQLSQSIFYEISLDCIRTMTGVVLCTYWLSSAISFLFLSISLFFSYFLWSLFLAEVLS